MHTAAEFKIPRRWSGELIRELQRLQKNATIGPPELTILDLFYDDHYKVQRRYVPKFEIYAVACRNAEPMRWGEAIAAADVAASHLEAADLVQSAPSHDLNLSPTVRASTGSGSETYELTKDGLMRLQKLHPPIALQLKGWINVLPPWLVLIGTIAGGIGALWKIVDLMHLVIARL